MIVIKALKKNYGELWRSAFAGDALLLRNAGDRDEHEWSRDDGEDWREPNPTFLADVFVPRTCLPEHLDVEVTARSCVVKVKGWGVWKRHWVYPCRVDESSWCLVDFDNRRRVQFTLHFRDLPRESKDGQGKNPNAVPKNKVKQLFLEDEDEHFTLALAQASGFLDYGDRFMAEDDLLPDARKVLASMRRDRPRHERKQPLWQPWSGAPRGQKPVPGQFGGQPVVAWTAS